MKVVIVNRSTVASHIGKQFKRVVNTLTIA